MNKYKMGAKAHTTLLSSSFTLMEKAAQSLPLYEKKDVKNTIARIVELIILFLLFSLLSYRLLSLKNHGFIWFIAFICELWFTFTWILIMNCKWSPVKYETFPERLLQRKMELPPVDIFVTTADPVLEPPIITMNTVLSLLAVDYPGNKLACYVSDDAASPLTFYCLVETSKFAKLWVPFCKKYNVPVRAPFRYFNGDNIPRNSSSEFQEEWKNMKEKYAELCQKIEDASQRKIPCDLTGDFAVFANIERKNHSTIIKVIWENTEDLPNYGIPHIIYLSREKRPKYPHHFKAGAMNVLTRVSGMMTNAPFILNVDCDMYANNPQVVLLAMCLLLGAKDEKESGFVQFPQHFYDGLKDDPFGNQMIVLFQYFGGGISGIQGPFYSGTGCIHRRKVLYGSSPEDKFKKGKLRFEDLKKTYGKSMKFIKLVDEILSESNTAMDTSLSLSNALIEDANHVASCTYDYGSSWGEKVGFIYGSATEDVFTGLSIHANGWKSSWCTPSPSGFLGLAPTSGPTSLLQQKRWSTGLFEILFSFKSPMVFFLTGKLQFRQCLAYIWIHLWAMRSVFEVCYAFLPAFCILNNTNFLPKVNEWGIVIIISIFVIFNVYSLSEYIRTGQTIQAWWNNQRMARLITMTSWLFGFLSVILKLIGLSETAFEVTKKDQSSNTDDTDEKPGRFTFDNSPLIIPGITILLVNLVALAFGLLGFKKENDSGKGWGIGEFVCSMWVVLCLWACLKGLFGKGKYGIPSPTIYKSGALALLFVHFSRSISLA